MTKMHSASEEPVGREPEALGELEGQVPRRQHNVLLAEDDPHVRGLLTRVLEGEGYRVLAGSDGGAALELARSFGTIDVVVTDVAMPVLRGPELVRELRTVRPGLPAVFITGEVEVPLGEILSSGPSELLTKPVSPSAVAAVVNQLAQGATPPPAEEG